ncbi:MAG: hypothetical protein KTR13_06165 [Saprospiraceae bacterium]|nr:hypothetical protein [Saprospiraceae bacterium]
MQACKFILRDDSTTWKNLLPLTYTRPISGIRIGIDTIQEKWEFFLNQSVEIATEAYLLSKFENRQPDAEKVIEINSAVLPNQALVELVLALQPGKRLEKAGLSIAHCFAEGEAIPIETPIDVTTINYPWDIFKLNHLVLQQDFERITAGRTSQPIDASNRVKHPENVFIEEGGSAEFSILDASKGPIYIGKDATIMAGSIVQGGLALCEGATLKLGTKHYGTSTLGPHSKFGGEFSNVVVQGYSNKGHEGFLGNAVLGEWCNLGADTNASNLKNNYGFVRVWNYVEERFMHTEEQFCGLIMGDHSKAGINTMFNTATVVGVAANIFGAGYPKKFLPSYTWGGVDFHRTFTLNKVFEMAEAMMSRRKVPLTDADKTILTHIFETTKPYRKD